jgi:hypothetical protein
MGPAGIDYFVQRLVAGDLAKMLEKLQPPDNNLSIPDFSNSGYGFKISYTNIHVALRNGSLAGFHPIYAPPIVQNPGGKFALTLKAANFTANYKWHESYHNTYCLYSNRGSNCSSTDPTADYDYGPVIGLLTAQVTLGFEFDPGTKTYEIKVVSSSGQSANITPNIPSRSVVQNQDQGCFTSKVNDATAQAVSSINFGGAIAQLIPPLLKSIPGSGKLANDIYYDFGLGESGIEFPADNKGLKIGVTGKVRYRDQEYPGTPPPALPLPPPPLDQNHLQVYVSAYELNALHWAYWKAGLLNTVVTPSDLPDPDVLKAKTYITMIPSFKPYAPFSMQAMVVPLEAPMAGFQEVYQFSKSAMESLSKQIPSDVYVQIQGLEGDGYATRADLEEALTEAQVPAQWFDAVRNTTKGMGMVAVQNIQFTLTIQNGAPQQPNVVFSVKRTDVLDNLTLGTSGDAQTMKYGFRKVKSAATFVSSTVPKFESKTFGDIIWPIAGEPRYSQTLIAMGQTGVPIPIMSGFHFLFDKATLSIQEGYVSILAQVTFKTNAKDAEVGHSAGRG